MSHFPTKRTDDVTQLKLFTCFDDMYPEDSWASMLLRGIYAYGFEEPTPCQQAVLPLLTKGRSIVMNNLAPEQGKTTAMLMGVLKRAYVAYVNHQRDATIVDPPDGPAVYPTAMLLCHSREMARDCAKVLRELGTYLPEFSTKEQAERPRRGQRFPASLVHAFVGGPSVQIDLNVLTAGCLIVVGTHGRLTDVLRRGALRTHFVAVFGVDDADEVIRSGSAAAAQLFERVPSTTQLIFAGRSLSPQTLGFISTYVELSSALTAPTQSTVDTCGTDSAVVVDQTVLHAIRDMVRFPNYRKENNAKPPRYAMSEVLTDSFLRRVECGPAEEENADVVVKLLVLIDLFWTQYAAEEDVQEQRELLAGTTSITGGAAGQGQQSAQLISLSSQQRNPSVSKMGNRLRRQRQCVVLCSSPRQVDWVCGQLQKQLPPKVADADLCYLHTEMSRDDRAKALHSFGAGCHGVLITMGELVRGVRFHNVDLVVSFHLSASYQCFLKDSCFMAKPYDHLGYRNMFVLYLVNEAESSAWGTTR